MSPQSSRSRRAEVYSSAQAGGPWCDQSRSYIIQHYDLNIMSMADGKDESSNTIQRDSILFFDCDLVVLQVIKDFAIHPFNELTVHLSFQAERTLFRVPRKTLTQSKVLKDLIGQKDSSEEKPIVLPEVTADEFRCFFKVAYSTQKHNV